MYECFTEKYFNSTSKSSVKMLYDMANIYKRFEKYEEAIKYYSLLLTKVKKCLKKQLKNF